MPEKVLRSVAHHIDHNWMREAYGRTRKDGAVGVDGQTSVAFSANLDAELEQLLNEAKSGSYRAPPVRRAYIPKSDGSQRPLGIPSFRDKVLQRAIVMALEPIYEAEFYDFSYGFRPGRSAHDALQSLRDQLWEMKGGWVLEVDISKFFDTVDRKRLRDIVSQRLVDGVVVRLLGKWLNAGVLEGSVLRRSDQGTVQGGVISPLLANIYLHEVLDQWWTTSVQPRLRGKACVVRYADDFVIAFSDADDARRVQEVLPKRFAKYGLKLHPTKTRLVDFRRPDGGENKPGTFDFLGFTHYWAKSRKGRWVPKQKTARDRLRGAARNIKAWCQRNRHAPVAEQARRIGSKLTGHYRYFGITGNWRSLVQLYEHARKTWHKWLSRRSQRAQLDWPAYRRRVFSNRGPIPSSVLCTYDHMPVRHNMRYSFANRDN
jgi:group II intron reverse transcriptase/maturase